MPRMHTRHWVSRAPVHASVRAGHLPQAIAVTLRKHLLSDRESPKGRSRRRLARTDLQVVLCFRLGGRLGAPYGPGRVSDVRFWCNCGIGLRADRLGGAVSLSQDLLRPLVQFDALAQQSRIAYAQVKQMLLTTASWCGHWLNRRLLDALSTRLGASTATATSPAERSTA